MKEISIFWQDLTEKKQQEIIQELGDDNNWDVYPICTIHIETEEMDNE